MSNLDNIEYIVVLMMENRSFDNILGWLYDPDNPPPFNKTPNGPFNGVNSTMSNPGPNGEPVYVSRGTDLVAPFPDPNEPYEYVYRQMYGDSPNQPVPNRTDSPAMQGFVIDYASAIEMANAKQKHKPPITTDPSEIMNCFGPESLPAINGLAQNYAVCDNWFSSVPTQTFPNRSFIHAATSSGNVYNTWKTGIFPWDIGIFINKTTTVYNLLEAKRIGWRVYHGGPLLLCNTLITQEKLWEYAFDHNHFRPYEQFLTDVNTPGALTPYTFIEPNMICSSKYGPENDMHPAYAIADHGPPTDVRYGDKLIYDIYTALKGSAYWDKTLFIITFDEHGGCFDHVPTPPPPTVSPDGVVIPYTNGRNGGSNFDFARFGVRVPAVLVSPWIESGTICSTQYDHTSVIRTVSEKWLGGQTLTARDAAANDVSGVLTSTCRTDDPVITSATPPPFTGCAHQGLSPLQRDMLAAAARFAAHNTDRLIDMAAMDTKEKVVEVLDQIPDDFVQGWQKHDR